MTASGTVAVCSEPRVGYIKPWHFDLYLFLSLLCEEADINYRAHEKREGAQREKGLGHENQKREGSKVREEKREGGRLLELDRGAGPAVQIGGGESSRPRTSSGSVPAVLLIFAGSR